MGKLLSVIIPVYNVEPYIRECVDSIINQTYKNLEIVLVDDGSPDNCGAICDEYAAKDSRVKVIHQKNQRLGAARNNGRKIATGDYITFVDSDDWLHLETVKWCMDAIEEYELDVIYFGSFRSGKGGDGTGKVTMSDPRAIWEWCTKYEGSLAWGCIIRKEMWEGIYFAEGRAFEEMNVSYLIYERVKKVASIDKKCYFYRKNPNGICGTSAMKPNNRYDYITAMLEKLEYAESKNFGVIQCRALVLKSILSYFTAFYGMGCSVDDKYTTAMTLLKKYREMPYDSSLLNGKYKIYLWCADRMDFVQKIGSKISLWSKKAKALIGK